MQRGPQLDVPTSITFLGHASPRIPCRSAAGWELPCPSLATTPASGSRAGATLAFAIGLTTTSLGVVAIVPAGPVSLASHGALHRDDAPGPSRRAYIVFALAHFAHRAPGPALQRLPISCSARVPAPYLGATRLHFARVTAVLSRSHLAPHTFLAEEGVEPSHWPRRDSARHQATACVVVQFWVGLAGPHLRHARACRSRRSCYLLATHPTTARSPPCLGPRKGIRQKA